MASPSQTAESTPASREWILANITDASQNTAQIYFLYVGALVYCALTAVSVDDQRLVLNKAVQLPIVGLDVSCSGFFILAPVILIFFFIYLQLYIARVRGLKADLKRICGTIEKRRLYPWLLNIAEDPDPNPIGRLQTLVAKFSLWWLLPIVLILFAVMFVKKHDPVSSYVVGSFPLVGTAVVGWFHHYASPQRGRRWSYPVVALVVLLCGFQGFLFYVIHRANGGTPPDWLKPFTCVDLRSKVLVSEPEGTEAASQYWGDLSGTHLEGAMLSSAILKRANLTGAHLDYAELDLADLDGAKLTGANLSRANLSGADLSEAILQSANLEEASLSYARLVNANLYGVDAKGADFSFANLHCMTAHSAKFSGATFEHANLMQADLFGATDLTVAGLSKARTLYSTQNLNPVVRDAVAQRAELGEEPQAELGVEDAKEFDSLSCRFYPDPRK